jgi:hypothetical protein
VANLILSYAYPTLPVQFSEEQLAANEQRELVTIYNSWGLGFKHLYTTMMETELENFMTNAIDYKRYQDDEAWKSSLHRIHHK